MIMSHQDSTAYAPAVRRRRQLHDLRLQQQRFFKLQQSLAAGGAGLNHLKGQRAQQPGALGKVQFAAETAEK